MYNKFVRLDPVTFEKVRKEALTIQMMTGKPCQIGFIVKQIVSEYYKNIEKKKKEKELI